jgi:lauroyl/myristoyl acyltransferase
MLSCGLGRRNLSKEQILQIAEKSLEIKVCEDLDTFYFPFLNEGNVDRYFAFSNLHFLDDALKQGKGALLFTGHFGSVCAPLVVLALKGYASYHLSRDSRFERGLNTAFRAHARLKTSFMSRKMGRELLYIKTDQQSYRQVSAAEATLLSYRLLSQNQTVSMAIDIPPGMAKGAEVVRFLGEDSLFPTGIVALAQKSGAPVIPFFVARDREDRSKQRLVLQEPVQISGDSRADLQRIVDRLSACIEQDPEQWFSWDCLSHFRQLESPHFP